MRTKKVRKALQKAGTACVAAALAFAMTPGSAFAAGAQINQDTYLGGATGEGVNTGTDAAAASGNSVPGSGSRAAGDQITVTAPLRVTFTNESRNGGATEGETPLDIKEESSWGPLTAPVTFTNVGAKGVYISELTVKQDGAEKVTNLFEGSVGNAANPALTLKNGTNEAKVETLTANNNSTVAIDHKTTKFDVKKNSSSEFDLVFDPTQATWKSTDDLNSANSLKGATTDFAKIVWTFAVSDGLSGSGAGNLTDDKGMYLKILDDPASLKAEESSKGSSKLTQDQLDMLESCKGEIFNVDDIKEQSRELGSDPSDTTSDLYNLYSALTDSLMPEGDYECMVEYKGAYDGTGYTISNFGTTAWPVRVVGLNQDTPTNAATYGANRVGLTFQFLDCISRSMLYNSQSNAGGWSGTNASLLRGKLRSGGTYFNNLTIATSGNLVTVDKKSDAGNKNTTTVNTTQEQLFLPSYRELVGNNNSVFTQSCIVNSGTGADFTEQYRFYQNKGIVGNNKNYKWLVKGVGPYWVSNASNSWSTMPTYNKGLASSTSAVTSLTDGNNSTNGTIGWERSTYPTNINNFLFVDANGSPSNGNNPNGVFGVAPCFCL